MINYFDIGSYSGVTIELMLDVFRELNIEDFRMFGFEPREKNYLACYDSFNHGRCQIFRCALSDTIGQAKLYYSNNAGYGDSLYASKVNVSEEHEEVRTLIFSQWLKKWVPAYKKDHNILQINVEGAEWLILPEIIKSGVYKDIDLFLGENAVDMLKVPELKDKHQILVDKMKEHEIVMHRFVGNDLKKNADVKKLIKEMVKT